MKPIKAAMAVVAVVAIMVLAAFAGMGCVMLDAMSNTATGSQTLSPAGNVTGKALVVYDPGITGAAKKAAEAVSGDLRDRGYAVDLAGVKSPAAADASGYDVIVVGGPTFEGNISRSIKTYLGSLEPSQDAKVGVFATGSVEPESDDPGYMLEFVAGLPAGGPLKVKASAKILANGGDVEGQCDRFVSELLR